jgi:hypothetical protein
MHLAEMFPVDNSRRTRWATLWSPLLFPERGCYMECKARAARGVARPHSLQISGQNHKQTECRTINN